MTRRAHFDPPLPDSVVTLPSGEQAAKDRMVELLDTDVLLVVALGDGEVERDLVERASQMVGGTGDPALVVWAKSPAHVVPLLEQTRVAAGLDITGRRAAGCFLSLTPAPGDPWSERSLVDVIEQHGDEPHYFRILEALAKAARP